MAIELLGEATQRTTSARRGARAALAATTFVLVGFAGRAAHAQSETDIAMRRQLIEEATRVARDGQNQRALELAQRAARIRMTPSLRAFIAAQQLATSRFVEALSSAELCVSEVRRDTTVSGAERLVADCSDVSTRSAARVGRVRLEGLDTSLGGLEVRVNGAAINAALLDVPIMTNPGSVTVEVTATGFRPFRVQLTVAAQQTVAASVTLERPSAATVDARPNNNGAQLRAANDNGSQRANTNTNSASSRPIVRDDPPRGPSLAGPVALMVAGGVGLALGGAMFGAQVATFGDCQQTPDGNVCARTTSVASAMPAVTFNRVAIASLAIGGAVLAGGVLWFALVPRPREARPRAWVAPTVSHDSVGVFAGGSL